MMITKAIVRGIPDVNNNKYRVYIPLFRNANDSEIDATFEATLCFLNGVFYSLAVDDVVYVDFEDNYYEKPVIIGKLYTNKEDKKAIPTQLTVKTIKVLDKAQFPSNTEIDSKSTSNFYKNIKNLQDDIWSLRKQIDDLKGSNLNDQEQNAFYQIANDLNTSNNISSLSSSVTTISQKVDKINYYNHSISIIISDSRKKNRVSLRTNWINTTSTPYVSTSGLGQDIWKNRDSNDKTPSIQASGVCQFGSEDVAYKGIIFALVVDSSDMELKVIYTPIQGLIDNNNSVTWTTGSIEHIANTTITDIVVPLVNNN